MVDTSILGKYFEANRTGGGGGTFADLKEVGDKVIGVVTNVRETQGTYQGKPAFWPPKDGQPAEPRMQLTLTLKTENGDVRLDIPKSKIEGSRMMAVNAALAAAQSHLELGGTLAIKVVSKTPYGQGFQRGHEARYQPPAGESE